MQKCANPGKEERLFLRLPMEFTYYGHAFFGVNPLSEAEKLDINAFPAENDSFYNSGDTVRTMDMQLIPRWAKLNFAVLPIGDNFTMGPEDALKCARVTNCKTVIGVHYDTFARLFRSIRE